VWVSYAGGNLTDWELWTATATKKTPRRLAFLERDTSDPAPVVVGAGTALGVPYAVETTVTWLGSNGAAIFHSELPIAVRAVTSGNGPNDWRVAALLDTGDVVVLNHAGAIDATYPFAPDQVKWIGLGPGGLVVQLPKAKVEIRSTGPTRTVQLPANAIVVDYAEGRILYRVGQSYRLRSVGTGGDVALLQGSRKSRLVVALDTHGMAWAQGRTVNWACAICIRP
jgi:hypothetical protein